MSRKSALSLRQLRTGVSPDRGRAAKVVPFTEARRRLAPILKTLRSVPHQMVGISVHGSVEAYLVSSRKLAMLEALSRRERGGEKWPKLKGSMELLGSLEEGSDEARKMISASIAETAKKLKGQ